MKAWRLEVVDNDLVLVPTFDFFNSNNNLIIEIPDIVKIRELLLQGTKEADKKIRQMGIVISHDAIVWRRRIKQSKKNNCVRCEYKTYSVFAGIYYCDHPAIQDISKYARVLNKISCPKEGGEAQFRNANSKKERRE